MSADNEKALETLTIRAEDGSISGNFMRLGATVTDLFVKDSNGNSLDVVTGFDDRSQYLVGRPTYFGASIGRMGNRIKNGQFRLPGGGDLVSVTKNHGKHSLHGGAVGYNRQVWSLAEQTSSSLTFTLNDPDGHEGYPGNVSVSITYTLANGGQWQIRMKATTDAVTPVALTQHVFFNLDGYKSGESVNEYEMQLQADRIVEVDKEQIPTGELLRVAGTPFDFQKAATLGQRLKQTGGIDHCLVFEDSSKDSAVKLSLFSPKSGVRMQASSNQKAIQVYTANNFDGSLPRKASQGGPSNKYAPQSAMAVEMQSLIDSVNNHEKWGMSPFLKPGEEYQWTTTYTFSVADGI